MRSAPRNMSVTIGVQNHHDIACSSEALFELIRAVGEPNCKAMFDAWAPALHGDDLIQSARKMGAITCPYHDRQLCPAEAISL